MSSNIDMVRQYIASKLKGARKFEDHDDIFENRLIDSLQFVEFTIYIEELTGKKVDLETINLDDFRTISKIERVFFAAA